MPDRIALGLPVEALATRMLAAFRFVAREIPHAIQLYKGLPGIHVAARNPYGGGSGGHGRRRRGAPGDDDRRDAHPRRALHLREPEELLPQGGPARLLGHPPDLHRAPPVGAAGVDGRPAGGRGQGAVLQLPDRARRVEGAAAAHRARGLLRPEVRLHRRRGLRGDEADGARPRQEAARPRGRAGPGGAGARLPGLDARRELHLPGQRALPVRLRTGSATACAESALGAFTDESLLPVVFPHLVEEIEARLKPSAGRPARGRHRLREQRLRPPPRGPARQRHRAGVGRRRASCWRRRSSSAGWPRWPSPRRRPTSRS